MDAATFFQQLSTVEQTVRTLDANFAHILKHIGWSPDELKRSHRTRKMPAASESPSPESSRNEDGADDADDHDYDFRSREQKLRDYELTLLRLGGGRTEPEMSIQLPAQLNEDPAARKRSTFAEITASQKRDQKRRRLKHRTAKAPPLTHSEEVRALIRLQMEAWSEYVAGRIE